MPQNEESSSRDDRVNEAIAAYLQAADRGEAPDRDKFLAEHADIAAELNAFFADQSQFRKATASLPPVHGGIDGGPGNQAQFQQVAEANPLPPAPSKGEPSADPEQPTLQVPIQGIPSSRNVIRYFGDYELLQEIARGGMGVVFKARQVNLNRVVALKMILAGQLAGPQDVQRFYTEAEAAAQLDHPGIVPVFEVGQHDGQHFFSMGFVEGQSLAKRVAEGPLEPRTAAEMVKTVAEAVQFAHEKGVIHRDLKPGNILLDKDGKPRITDFGLAKLTESGSDLTGTGQILGTPSYMPPEQASGKIDLIGPAADIYALGAILYCLLTGRPPFQAASPMDTLLQVLDQEPVPPRQLNPNIPLDLDTIVLKCLDKSPSRRYSSAKTMAEELTRFVAGRPILARRVSRLERFQRWCKREPLVASLSAAVFVALIAGTIISSYYGVLAANRANEKAKLADEKGKLADENGKLALDMTRLATEKGQLAENNRLLFESERDAKEEQRLAKEQAVTAAQKEEQERVKAQRQLRISTAERLAMTSHMKRSESPELSLLLAVESGRATRHDEEGFLASSHQALLDALTGIGGRPLVGHRDQITCLAISPDNRWVVTQGRNKTPRLWLWQWDDLAARAGAVGRNFDRDEWKSYFPDEAYRKTFSDLPIPETEAPQPAGPSEVERRFELADKDKNGEISEEEWNSAVLVRAQFLRAGIVPSFPITKDEFSKLYPQETAMSADGSASATTGLPVNDGLSDAERQFDSADKDKNGEICEDEFNRNFVLRLKFQRAGITPTFPLRLEEFVKLYRQPVGRGANPARTLPGAATFPAPAMDIPRTAGLSMAERFFDRADKDKNGEISEDEFNSNALVRVKFKNAGITPKFPIARDEFLKLYPQPGGK